ncbi:uncharacterized protein LOC114283723 [Camellia sinensis]|uniref:uncharacterized protein LOC114283723 n=1 Tax=Camellia sinensis TaxID=4442 RepID=UPI0010366951|nr:uncharacterized protein LOC114283723 [Camellia sinensis]
MESISSMVYVECNNKQFAVSVLEGQVSMDFAEEIEQKWGLSSHAEHRSESSVVGGRSKNTQRPEVAVDNDEEQFYSSQKATGLVGAVVAGMHGHWDSVSAVNESCSVHDGQRVDCHKEGSKFLNCVRPVNDLGLVRTQMGFMRSISTSIGPQPSSNLEVVLGEPSFVGPSLGIRCGISDLVKVGQIMEVEPSIIGDHLQVADIEGGSFESVEDGISGSTTGVVNKVHSKANLQLRGGKKERKNPLPVEPIRGVTRP